VAVSIGDIGSIANILSAVAVVGTLVYLSRQLKLGNLLARAQVRQRMVEQANAELYVWMNDANLRECFAKAGELTREEQGKLHYFLLAAMRAREWEWFQYRDGVISADVYKAYIEVVGLHLGIARTRHWWRTVGRIGFDPAFVAAVDALLESRPPITYFEDSLTFDSPAPSARRG
jgi:hypothetical protein